MNYSLLRKKLVFITVMLIIGIILLPIINADSFKINIFTNKNSNIIHEFHNKFEGIDELNNKILKNNNLYEITDEYGIHKYAYLNKNQIEKFQEEKIKKIEFTHGIISNKKIDKNIIIRSSENILYVGGNGPNNYTNIQDAIDNTSDGDTVFVYDDSSPYFENIIIDKSIQLIGENKDTTVVNGSKLDSFLDTINITANNVDIQGFSINYNYGFYYQAAILVTGDHVTISNCKFYNNNWVGISCLDTSYTQIFNCEFFYNLIALHLVDSNNNIIKDCYFYENSDDIVLFENSHANKILNCTCIGNSFSGIHIQHSSGNQVINCTIKNGYEGIGLAYAPNTKLQGNTINNNIENFGIGSLSISDFICDIDTSNAINGKPIYYWINHYDEQIPSDAAFIGLISCTNITVKNINITDNFQGIVCVDTTNSIIENCDFIKNGGHGIFFVTSSNNKIYNCACANNFFSGVYLNYQSNNNMVFENNISNIQVSGFWIEESINNQILNHNINNCYKGISLDKSPSNILRENKMFNCGLAVDGVTLYDYINDVDTTNTVNGKTLYYIINETGLVLPTNTGQVVLINSKNCNISNLDLSNGTVGIELAFSSNNTISKNIINNNKMVAIDLDCSSNNFNKIYNNNIIDNSYGVDIDLSDYNTIQDNIITESNIAISLDVSDRNNIFKNDIKNCYNGIYLTNSNNNQLNNNSIKKCSFTAIYLLYSKNNLLKENDMDKCGLIVYGNSLSEYTNSVDTSNKVNGKSLYYLINENGFIVPNDAGEVVLINCDYCIVSNLNICNGTVGAELAYSDFNTISKNTLNNNKFAGIYLETSNGNSVETNYIKNNSYGISMQLADENDIINNKIQNNYYGFYISVSDVNIFSANDILYNTYGIYFNIKCSDNTIHHNNLYYNGYNAWDENKKTNTWDNGKKGNYWSDYTTKYPNARRIWLKGIWNTPYEIPEKENFDRFPLILPYSHSKEKNFNLICFKILEKISNFQMILKIIHKMVTTKML